MIVSVEEIKQNFLVWLQRVEAGEKITILKSNKSTKDMHFHDNFGSISVGSGITINENVREKTVTISVDGTSNIDTLETNNIASIGTMLLASGDVDQNVINEGKITYHYYSDYYTLKFPWDDTLFKERTGRSISDTDWFLSGMLRPTLSNVHTGNSIAYSDLYSEYTFSHPIDTGVFYYGTSNDVISGYYNDETLSVYTPTHSAAIKSILHYNDGDNDQIIDLKGKTSINLNTTQHSLRGKQCQIQSHFSTIASDYKTYSPPVVPTYNDYYDIQNVVVTMSGIRYDPSLGRIRYTTDYMRETAGVIQQNYLARQFSSVDEAMMVVSFNASANTTGVGNETRSYTPHPSGIWLINISKEALYVPAVRNYFLKIKESAMLSERNTPNESTKFPKISSRVAAGMTGLCTGTPHVRNARSIVWNSIFPNNPDAPENGTFTNEDYTIYTTLTQDSWAPFIVISATGTDGHQNYTGYCLSNIVNYDVPTAGAFTDI